MHMADALLSPAVGAAGWAVSGGLLAYCSAKVKKSLDEKKIPLMGVLGAFVFAAQMINFTIPATGSSGHLGGAMLLAILLGPYAAFITIASVLTIQAFFFADGGILALGCNIFNLGFFPCFVAYPFIYKLIAKDETSGKLITAGSFTAAVIGLQLGAFFVVLETVFSGISELPFSTFVLMMQPVHLAIGVVEGLVTAAVVMFVWRERPEVLTGASLSAISLKKTMASILILAVFTGAVLSWFASSNPDGLEWSMFKTSGHEELATPDNGIYNSASSVQEKTSFLPDYGFKTSGEEEGDEESWPAVSAGTSVSGIVGGGLTLLLAFGAGALLRRKSGVVTGI
jgi:cobalt/nickel transport system permease protein